MRTIAVLAALVATSVAQAETIEQYLAAPANAPERVEDLGAGEPWVIEGGMHDGHASLRWPALALPGTDPHYALSYHVCVEREAHPNMLEVWPREGGLGVGMTAPTGCNFYSGGFIDVLIDGASIGGHQATIERLTWPAASGYRFTWDVPRAAVTLLFVGRDGQDHLTLHGAVQSEEIINTVEVRLRCFPSSFAEPRERFVATASRELDAGARALLAPDECWALFADRHFDEAALPDESHGPCALLFEPMQMSRAMLDVGAYQLEAQFELMPGQTSFDLALWEFPDVTNEAALAAMQQATADLEPAGAQQQVVDAPPRVLVSDGRPAATIVLPAEPTVCEETAARDLQLYVHQMSGAFLPVVRSGPVPAGNRLLVGAVAGHAYTDPPAGTAGFELRTDGRDVLVRGEDDYATLYAACELLERLGVRWFLPGRIGEVVPQMATVTLPELDEVQRPDFAMRWIGNDEWSYRNKCNGDAGGIGRGFNVRPHIYHSQYRFMSTRDWFDEHPEWFALYDGRRLDHPDAKPCVTNPEMIRRTAANMAGLLEAEPDTDMVSLSYTDGSYYCQCPGCTALDEPDVPRDQSMSRRTLIFYNAVAEELARTHPEARILAGAYHVYNRPPADRSLRAHPSLSLVLCHYTEYCNAHPVNDPTCPPNVEYNRLLRDWQRIIPDVYFYEYYHSDGNRHFPWQLVSAIRADIPYYRELGCGGLFTQYGQVWNTFLSYYIGAQLLWDADADVDALLADLYERFFGPAREPMERYYTAIIDAIAGTQMHTCTCSLGGNDPRTIFTDGLIADIRAALEEAKRLAAGDRLVLARLRKVEASQEYAERFIEYLDLRDRALAMTPGPERHAAATEALAAIESLHDEVTQDRQKWEGICSAGSYHWRFDLARARELAQPPPVPIGEKLRDLPLQWRFALDPDDVGLAERWFAIDFDDAQWASVEVGRHWERQGYQGYDGIAWYRLAVEITADDVAAPLLLAFGGVDADARVFLNGREIGQHEGWDEPFSVELPPDQVRVGEANLIVVRVRDTSADGGIYGTVSLGRPK